MAKKNSKRRSKKTSRVSSKARILSQTNEDLKLVQSLTDADIAIRAKLSFPFFYRFIWRTIWEGAHYGEKFTVCAHALRWCKELQNNRKTSKESARAHLKSSVLYAYIGWLIFKRDKPWEIMYLSYSHDLAAHHVSECKKVIESDKRFFGGLQWTSDAASIISCVWDDRPELHYSVYPSGIASFKRGLHPDGVIADDILRDPTMRKLNTDALMHVNTIFAEQVTMLPKWNAGGFLHVWGTSQDTEDLFAQNRKKALKGNDADGLRWHCTTEQAYKTETVWTKDKLGSKTVFIPLCPELYSYEKLMAIKVDIGPKAFAKEMMCAPVRGEESFFTDAAITAIIQPNKRNLELLHGVIVREFGDKVVYVVGGMDLGKKRHPSHISIGVVDGPRVIQVYSKFMDGWEYTKQVEHCLLVDGCLSVDRWYYDNTRSEFEIIAEQGKLPGSMDIKDKDGKSECAISFTTKSISAMAVAFERFVNRGLLQLLDDPRQKRLILAVDNDFKAVETSEGHGDSFYSVGLMCLAAMTFATETELRDLTGIHSSTAVYIEEENREHEVFDESLSETLEGLGVM